MATYTGTNYDNATLTPATPGASSSSGSLTIAAGDSYVGGTGSNSLSDITGVAAPGYRTDAALTSVAVNGSTFVGGDDDNNGAPGAILYVDASGTLSITAGSFTGGATASNGTGGPGAAVFLGDNGTGTISGGSFYPGNDPAGFPDGFCVALCLGPGATLTISGGDFGTTALNSILAIRLGVGAVVTLTGSSLSLSGVSLGGTLTGGQSLSGILFADLGSNISVSGGGATLTLTGT